MTSRLLTERWRENMKNCPKIVKNEIVQHIFWTLLNGLKWGTSKVLKGLPYVNTLEISLSLYCPQVSHPIQAAKKNRLHFLTQKLNFFVCFINIEEDISGFAEILASAHDTGAVQYTVYLLQIAWCTYPAFLIAPTCLLYDIWLSVSVIVSILSSLSPSPSSDSCRQSSLFLNDHWFIIAVSLNHIFQKRHIPKLVYCVWNKCVHTIFSKNEN